MSNKPAILQEKTIVDMVQNNINGLMQTGNLQLPEGYAASTALREAYLILRETVDRNKQPVLSSCSMESIASALLMTVVSGFYPARKHCYYLAYKNQLVCQPSYFGQQMLAKRLNPDLDSINASLIFKGDEIEIEVVNGEPIVVSHKQKFQPETNIDVIDGAYCMAIDKNGRILHTVIMGKADILKSWKQSKQYPINKDGSLKEGTVHEKFSGEMAKRTVINRLCKKLINTSKNDTFLTEKIQQNEISIAQGQLAETSEENANAVEFQPEDVELPVELPSDEQLAELANDNIDGDPFGEENED